MGPERDVSPILARGQWRGSLSAAKKRAAASASSPAMCKCAAMPDIAKEKEPGVGEPLLKDDGVHGRDHDVVVTTHHQGPVPDVLQVAVAVGMGLRKAQTLRIS